MTQSITTLGGRDSKQSNITTSFAVVLTMTLIASVYISGVADAQIIDNESKLGVRLTTAQPVSYVDDDGHTVVIGEVRNFENFSVTNVRIQTSFYTDTSATDVHEVEIGDTILEVIPPLGSSPFVIRSPSPDPTITGFSTNLLGFTSSSTKLGALKMEESEVSVFGKMDVRGIVLNTGTEDALNPIVYALVYDALVPPRLIGVHSVSADVILPGDSYEYELSFPDNEHASFVRLIAESDNYASDSDDAQIIRHSSYPIVIQDITTVDSDGDFASTLRESLPVYIRSTITAPASDGLKYTYIVQVKSSAALPVVEFIGSFDGMLLPSGAARPIVEWTPESNGLFYVETYVWGPEGTPLSAQGPITLLHVG